jgi:hypothetical protein
VARSPQRGKDGIMTSGVDLETKLESLTSMVVGTRVPLWKKQRIPTDDCRRYPRRRNDPGISGQAQKTTRDKFPAVLVVLCTGMLHSLPKGKFGELNYPSWGQWALCV